MKGLRKLSLALLASVAVGMVASTPAAAQQPQPQTPPQQPQQQQRPPNILVIMGDDVGWFNIGAYHRGIMSGRRYRVPRLTAEREQISARSPVFCGHFFHDLEARRCCSGPGKVLDV